MLDATAERFGLTPKQLIADSAYGPANNLAWLVKQRKIEPHIPVIDNHSVRMTPISSMTMQATDITALRGRSFSMAAAAIKCRARA